MQAPIDSALDPGSELGNYNLKGKSDMDAYRLKRGRSALTVLLVILSMFVLFTTGNAHATTVTFDGLVGGSSSYTEAGMTFATNANGSGHLDVFESGQWYGKMLFLDNDSNFVWYALSISMGGAAFDLNSIHANVWGYNQAVLTAYSGNAQVSTMLIGFGGANGDVNFGNDWKNITALYWYAGWFGAVGAMDNINFNAAAPAPVPEPSTLILTGGGLAGLVMAARTRKKRQG